MRTTDSRRRVDTKTERGTRRYVVAAAVAIALYSVGFIGVVGLGTVVNAVVVAALVGAFGYAGFRRRQATGSQGAQTSLGEALLAIAATLVIARWLSGLGVEVYALVVIAVAWVVATASGRTTVWAVGAALVGEGLSHGLGTAVATSVGPEPIDTVGAVDWSVLGARWGAVVVMALLIWSLVGRQGEKKRQAYDREVEEQRQRLLEEAHEFRLIHAGRTDSPMDRKQAEELIVRDAVDAVHHTVFMTLELIKTALNAHTVIVLWFDIRNESLHIKEMISDSDDIVEGDIDPAGGVIGGITRQRDTVRLSGLRGDYRGLAYYHRSPGVTEFMGAPIIEQGHLRGVLCVDRDQDKAFDGEELRIAEEAAEYVLRAVENERMVASIERTRFEVGRFYEASRRLNGVLTPAEVYEVALESIREIAAYDFAAITLYDDTEDRHSVVRVEGDSVQSKGGWDEVEFESNQGLVSMVVRNRHYLPVGGQLRNRQSTVLSEAQDFSKLRSLLVLPLIVQDEAVGTLVVGHHQPGEFPTERREMLEVVTNQVAVTLQNARLYAQMEEMAKFDALTGLANRRTFQQRLEQTMARHKRAGRTFGLVLTDIDHFKSVNDTYGHPVGDEVLRQVGDTFREEMREVDLPARYGGEEFAMVLEDTDIEGARQVAERLRKAIAALEFQTDQGPLQCTISMGIAVGPWDSDEPHTLVDLADQALYHSKENGRNRVSVYQEVVAGAAA